MASWEFHAVHVAYLLLVLFHVPRGLRFVWRLGLRSALVRLAWTLARSVRLCESSVGSQLDELELLVNREVLKLRKESMVRLTYASLVPYCGLALSGLVAWARVEQWQPLPHLAVWLVVFAKVTVMSIQPWILRSDTLRRCQHASFMVLGMAGMWTAIPETCMIGYTNAYWLLARLPTNLVHGNTLEVVVWNGVSVLSMSVLLFRIAPDPSAEGYETKDRVLTQELQYSVFTVLITILADRFLKTSIRHMLEAKGLSQTNVAMSHLLNLFCDSVVELDSDHCFIEPPEKFAALLHMGQASALEGKSFQRFIASDEDRKKFESHLVSPSIGENTMPQVCNLVMSDSMQQRVEVQIFHVTFLDLESRTRFLVGVKEETERAVPLAPMKRFKKKRGTAEQEKRHMRGTRGTPSDASPRPLVVGAAAASADGGDADDDAGGGGEGDGCGAEPLRPRSRSSDCSSERRLDAVPCHRNLPLTGGFAMRLATWETLSRFNVPVKATMCCGRHALIHAVRKTLDAFQEQGCGAMVTEFTAQCSDCGVLDDAPDEGEGPWHCEVCTKRMLRPIKNVMAL